MATSLRRSKTMPADGQTAKFLYTIIKQLDLKSIDWNLVASQLDISNGHAARMRYSRFKQHMEGIQTTPRNPRPKKTPNKKPAKGDLKAAIQKQSAISEIQAKQECQDIPFNMVNPCNVKNEPGAEPTLSLVPPAMPSIAPAAAPIQATASPNIPYPFLTVAPSDLTLHHPSPVPVSNFHSQAPQYNSQHLWAPVKMEQEDDVCMGDVLVKVEPQGN